MNSNFSNVQEDLLVKYLLGEATDAERREVSEWIEANAENQQYYEHFALIWNESKKIEAASEINIDDAWNRFRARTGQTEQQEDNSGSTKVIPLSSRMSWIRAAAVLVVVVGAGWMAYHMAWNNSAQLMAVNSGNSVLTDTLPDGSIVTLNKNSSIAYNSKLDGGIRQVKLEGEAFFNVAPDKEHPFVIEVNGSKVTVVGTSFNIKSTAEKTEVVVETGIVDVEKKNNKVTLRPNQKATVFADKDNPVKESADDELYNYYKTKEFVCRNTPLSRLVEVLNEAFGVNIVISNPRLNGVRISTTFSYNDGLQEALRVVEINTDATIQQSGNSITLQ